VRLGAPHVEQLLCLPAPAQGTLHGSEAHVPRACLGISSAQGSGPRSPQCCLRLNPAAGRRWWRPHRRRPRLGAARLAGSARAGGWSACCLSRPSRSAGRGTGLAQCTGAVEPVWCCQRSTAGARCKGPAHTRGHALPLARCPRLQPVHPPSPHLLQVPCHGSPQGQVQELQRHAINLGAELRITDEPRRGWEPGRQQASRDVSTCSGGGGARVVLLPDCCWEQRRPCTVRGQPARPPWVHHCCTPRCGCTPRLSGVQHCLPNRLEKSPKRMANSCKPAAVLGVEVRGVHLQARWADLCAGE